MQPSRSVWTRRALLTLIALLALWHGSRYDFFCDDAFIALRYAKNLSENGELAYNLGQRVEGFTSPLWVLLLAAAACAGVPLVTAAQILGGAAALLAFWALTLFWDELEPNAPWLVLVPAAALAISVPFAAWTFGGLETPLFVATFTLSIALIARDSRLREVGSSWYAGIAVALCTLCRPEGATLIAIGSLAISASSPRTWSLLGQRLLAWGAPIALLVGGYELFRLRYYGYPLPNTFYVKTSGDGLWQRGLSYLGFAGSEFGWVVVCAMLLSFAYLLIRHAWSSSEPSARGQRALIVCALIASIIHLLYVARVGGDFLDLYRFLTPLLPGALCCAVSAGARGLLGAKRARGFAVFGLGAYLVAYGGHQRSMAQHATEIADDSRAALHLEPLGWTRVYARRWAGIGRFLAKIRRAGDSTAVGAAGALPFHSELPNLDLFGLNDLEIARNGRIIGNRPGHQRFARVGYLLAQKPTFIFMNPESTPPTSTPLRYDRYWLSQGYLPIEIRVDRELCGCDETFHHQFLVRRERADSLRGRTDAVVGGGPR